MTKEEIRKIVIAINDARLDGRITREIHATQIAAINGDLIAAGFTWEDLA